MLLVLLAVLSSQGIVVKCTAAIIFRTLDSSCNLQDNGDESIERRVQGQVLKNMLHAVYLTVLRNAEDYPTLNTGFNSNCFCEKNTPYDFSKHIQMIVSSSAQIAR